MAGITIEVKVHGTQGTMAVELDEEFGFKVRASGILDKLIIYGRHDASGKLNTPVVRDLGLKGTKGHVPLSHIVADVVGKGCRVTFVDGNPMNLRRENLKVGEPVATRRRRSVAGRVREPSVRRRRYRVATVSTYIVEELQGDAYEPMGQHETEDAAWAWIGRQTQKVGS